MIKIFGNKDKELHTDIDTYVVTWFRRYGEYCGDIEKCYQSFTDKNEAELFAQSIRDANELIGNTSKTKVSVDKNTSGGFR